MSAARATGPDALAALVLAGGASRRMGHDKALVDVDGVPLGRRVGAVLVEAGADPVVAVGGAGDRFRAWGHEWVADRWPGEGPLGGLVTGLDHLRSLGFDADAAVLVVAVDLPWLAADHLVALVDRLRRSARDAIVPRAQDRVQVLVAAYRLRAVAALADAFAAGERSPTAALAQVDHDLVDVGGEGAWLRDVDTPDDLAGG